MLEPDFRAYQAEWSELEKSDNHGYVPLIRELPGWIRDFPFYLSHDELCFTHCPAYPFSRAGMPTVVCQDGGFCVDEEWFASAVPAAARLGELLADQHQLIFSGNVDHKAYAWLRDRLDAEIGGVCPLDRSPWFERADRQCLVSWADCEIGLEFVEAEQIQDSGSYSWEEAVSRVASWLGQQ